jgi:nitrate/nitrite transport system ATP-binding protein
MNSYLDLSHLSMTFPTDNGPLNVLDKVVLQVAQGEFISLIGHSGCGKSTVLNIIAGLLRASSGGVVLEGKEVTDPGPDRAVVFQNHSLLPWLSVYDNVRLAVDQVFKKTKSKQERHDWTLHNLELVHMTHALDRRPDEISGGMKQRVGIARALAMEPKVLLMDEPFGALDSLTRTHMQDSLMEIHARLNNTAIMITHDVDEAVLLSDRIIMMTNGPSATIGQILDVNLERPRDRLALAEDPTYNHYRAEVVKFLHERHQNPAKAVEQQVASTASSNVFALPTQTVATVNHNGDALEKTELSLGFVPLTDCAPLVVAREQGFFAKHGLNVELSRESSWANIRDKVCAGMLDGAQMLAAMPITSVLGNHHCTPMVTAMSLDLNGNAITVSKELYGRMVGTGIKEIDTPQGSARALKVVIDQDKAAGRPKLTFAIVFAESSHNYLLRYWLAYAGIDPDTDVRLRVVPPPQMAHYLRAGMIAGYCVGEPWNAFAVSEGLGRTLLTSYDIWNNHPEKVFAVTRVWAQKNPNTHIAVISALLEACQWLDQPENRVKTAELLHHGRYVNTPVEVLEKSLTGSLRISTDEQPRSVPDFNVFHRYAANFPWRSHALWFLSQMKRWGQLESEFTPEDIARSVYQPDVYREAARKLGIEVPRADMKTEGIHAQSWQLEGCAIELGADRFMDHREFDPNEIDVYVDGFEIKHVDASNSITGKAV